MVAAAADLADAEGLAALSVAGLASRLGVRAPSLYNHVPGRDGLVRGIAIEAAHALAADLRAAAVGRGGEEALVAAAHAYRAYAHRHPGRYEAMQQAPAPGDEEHAAAAAEAVEVLFAVLRGWRLEGDEVVHAARTLRSALHGFVDLERVGGFGLAVPLDASFERLVRVLVGGLDERARP